MGLVGKSWVTIGGISLGFSTRIAMPEVVVVVLWVLKPGGTMRFGTRTDSGRVSGSWTPEPVALTLGLVLLKDYIFILSKFSPELLGYYFFERALDPYVTS